MEQRHVQDNDGQRPRSHAQRQHSLCPKWRRLERRRWLWWRRRRGRWRRQYRRRRCRWPGSPQWPARLHRPVGATFRRRHQQSAWWPHARLDDRRQHAECSDRSAGICRQRHWHWYYWLRGDRVGQHHWPRPQLRDDAPAARARRTPGRSTDAARMLSCPVGQLSMVAERARSLLWPVVPAGHLHKRMRRQVVNGREARLPSF